MFNYFVISIFVSFPETLIVLLIGLSLTKMNISYKRLLAISALQAAIALMLMKLRIGSGYTTITQIASLYFLVILILNIQFYKAVIPVLIGAFSQGALQSIVLPLLNMFFKIEITALQQDYKRAIICFSPVFIISVIILLLIRINKFFIIDIEA